MPPLDYVWVMTTFYEEGVWFQYFSSVYHAILMLTGNDLGPRGTFQTIFISSAVFMGAIINANIFGELAVLLGSINRKRTKIQEKIDTANTVMKNIRLPDDM